MSERENPGSETPVTAEEVRTNLSELLNRARFRGERFVITWHGKEVASLVPREQQAA